ncbi:DUF4012 domain-containing protein [Nocardioides sp. DS6]|uniref:DUF4012 domain-containing protein n=1 Tax=Nocardioides eburneus TaxID=3231482 RepID=A0ABV3SV18_9ACTN
MSNPKRWILSAVGALVVVLVVLGVYAAWQAHQVQSSLSAATDDAAHLQSAVADGDSAGIDRALASLRTHSRDAHERTDGWVWSLATHLPAYGDDARGVRVASRVVADLSDQGLASLAQSATDLSTIVPKDGKVDIAAVTKLQGGIADASTALAGARDELATQDPSGYLTGLKNRYRDLEGRIDSAASTMASADIAAKILPTMLGGDGPRNYLLVMQNNAEIRSTGGLPGAVSLLHTQNGKITMPVQVAGNEIPMRKSSVLPLTAAERNIYGDQLGTYFLDANVTPDFARTADLWKARWEEVRGEHVDGVITVDAVELGYLLAATGPVTVQGVELTPDNATDVLLHQVYVKIPDPTKQDVFFRAVAKTVFDRIANGTGSPQALIRALGKGAIEHRVLIHSFHADVQKRLTGTPVAGDFVTASTSSPQVTVSLNDSTMSKMSYFLRYDAAVRSTYCTSGVQGLTGSATFTSTLSKDNVAKQTPYILGGYRDFQISKGSQIVTIFIHGPVGGTISHVMQDGKPDSTAWLSHEDGRPVAQLYVTLEPGQKVDLGWQMKSGKGQTGDADLDVTPGLDSSASAAKSSCH